MRPYLYLLAGFWVFLSSCRFEHGNSIMINNDNDNLSVRYDGQIHFNEDETEIQSISSNGYLKFKRNGEELDAKNDPSGHLQIEITEGGRRLNPNDETGKRVEADAVKELIEIGFDAKERMERIYKKGGATALMEQESLLKMDYVKAMYFEFLLSQDSLPANIQRNLARKIGSDLGSDYDRGRLLQQFPENYLQDTIVIRNWFESLQQMGSDYDKANAIVSLLHNSNSTIDPIAEVCDIVHNMGSDYEKSRIVRDCINRPGSSISELDFDKLLESIGEMGSDYEKANLIRALIGNQKQSGAHFDKLLDISEHINDEYDRVNLIKELVDAGVPADADFGRLISAVVHTNSDYDRGELIHDLAAKNMRSNEQWIEIIEAAATLNSDEDKCNLLVTMAPVLPKTDSVRSVYMKTAKTINQEFELGRAMKALE